MQNMLGAWRMCAAGNHVSTAQRSVPGNSGMQPTFIPTPSTVQYECSESTAQDFARSPSGQNSADRCPAGQLMTDDDQLKLRVHTTLQHIIRKESDEILSEWMASMMGNTVPCGAPLHLTYPPTDPIHGNVWQQPVIVWASGSTQPCLIAAPRADPPHRDRKGHPPRRPGQVTNAIPSPCSCQCSSSAAQPRRVHRLSQIAADSGAWCRARPR